MYNKGKVLIGILIVILFFTMPFWLNLGKKRAHHFGEVIAEEGTKCVESSEYMRANHMKLLLEWRHKKVREGEVYYINTQGKQFKMSLQETCIKCHKNSCMMCHENKGNFCERCHEAVAVEPDCTKCHLTS